MTAGGKLILDIIYILPQMKKEINTKKLFLGHTLPAFYQDFTKSLLHIANKKCIIKLIIKMF